MGEDARETQNIAQETTSPNGEEGRNPCKSKTTMIPKVILDDPQTQLYKDQMKTHALICNFMGLWPTERTLCNWIKYQWKPGGEVDLQLGTKGFFTKVFMNLEDRDKIFEGGGGGILPHLSRTVHATMEGKLFPRKRNFQKCTCMDETLLLVVRLLATFYLLSNREQTGKICEDIIINPKRTIHLLCKNLHRDGCAEGTPRSHKPGIQGRRMDTKH
jgi:hypothetical protein